MTHNYFYKITNLINGNYYYGIHSTNNLEDGYMGGGDAIKSAIKKHGKENFTKEIIADYSTRKEASDHEKKVVTFELIQLKECYNCRTGGDNEYIHSKESKKKISEARYGKCLGEYNHNFGKTINKETRNKISESRTGKTCGENNPMFGIKGEHHPSYGKVHSEETKEKMRNKPSCKSCIILGQVYVSQQEASRQLNLSLSTLHKRIKSKNFKDWQYSNKET